MWTALRSGAERTSPRGSRGRVCALSLGVAALLLLGFLIGWFTKPTDEVTAPISHEKVKKVFMAEMKAENIKQFLYNFTRRPHLAGTAENLRLAQQIQAQWKEFGLDSVELVHYDVLLSYPNKTNPNYISIIDEHGNEIFNTSLFEPPPPGYETVTDVVPPYSAFSAQGVPEVKSIDKPYYEQRVFNPYPNSFKRHLYETLAGDEMLGTRGYLRGYTLISHTIYGVMCSEGIYTRCAIPSGITESPSFVIYGGSFYRNDDNLLKEPGVQVDTGLTKWFDSSVTLLTSMEFPMIYTGESMWKLKPMGELVYVNYGRTEDFFKLERELGINCTGKIVIARYGKIFRGNKVKNAELVGAKGVILYSDPADYCAPGVDSFPNGWNLPGGGAQRGNVLNLNGAGDPLTPGYPAKEYTYRYEEARAVGLPKLPVHPIGYNDAEKLLRNMGGPAPPDSSWKGSLNVSYNIGPGFMSHYSTRKVKMHIHSSNKVTRIYNVIGTIRGATEPDRYVILGGHRDSWVFGGINPQSGAAVVHEIVRSYGKLKKEGWRPRRTMIFASWDAEEFGLLGSTEWAEENAKLLEARGVAYINADSSVEGNYTLRIDCTPLMYSLVYSLTKEIPSPDEGFKGKSLYESWHEKNPSTEYKDVPRINKLGSGNDFEVFFQRLGIASGRARYSKNWRVEKYSSYPVYHSVYDTYEIVERFYDPTFKNHLTVAQVRGGLIFELADSVVLPFDCRDYAEALRNYAQVIYNLSKNHQMELTTYSVSFDSLFSAAKNFTDAATDFHRRLQQVDINNSIAVRSLNDQLMFLERAFIDPLGLPGRPFYRHIIFAPSSHNKYAGESFPGIYDAMFDIENKVDQRKAWEEVKRQISIAAFTVQAAAGTLKDLA